MPTSKADKTSSTRRHGMITRFVSNHETLIMITAWCCLVFGVFASGFTTAVLIHIT